jgi:hypothetical protein
MTPDLATLWRDRPAEERAYYETNIVDTIGETVATALGWQSSDPARADQWAAECEVDAQIAEGRTP